MKKCLSIILSLAILHLNAGYIFADDTAFIESVEVSNDTVIIHTDQPVQYDSFITSEPPRIVLEMFNSSVKTEDDKPLEGSGQFLKSVQVLQYQKNPLNVARVVLQLKEKAHYEIAAVKNSIGIFLKGSNKSGKTAAPAAEGESKTAAAPVPAVTATRTLSVSTKAKEYVDILNNLPKEPITLDYDTADIRDVLDMMASKINVNMVYADDVAGDISLRLTKVPYDEAFSTILAIKGLAAQQMGSNVLRIATSQTLSAEKTQAPQVTKVYPLRYLKAAEAKDTVMNVITAEGRKGTVNTEATGNILIVTDTPAGIESVSRLINQLDQKPIQVLIETKIVEVNLNNAFNFGISWSGYGGDYSNMGGSNGYNFFGTGNISNQSANVGVSNTGLKTAYDGSQTIYTPMPNTSANGGTGVSFPSVSGEISVGAFRFGRITNNYFLDVTIAAAEQKGKVKVLSDPKVSTLNNREAKINITTQIPYVTTTTTNSNPPISTTQVVYIDTGIQLQVTPQVNEDGKITMKIKPTVSQKATSVAPAVGGAPGVDKRDVETTVMTHDGETIVIGGLIYDSMGDTIYKVPLLGDIPLIGWFFKKKSTSRQRIELLIFVTPRIVN